MFDKTTIAALRHIAIVRLSALGDVIMMMPLIHTLQKALPDCRLTWIISRPLYPLVAGLEGVDFIVIDKPRTPYDYWKLSREWADRRFDLLLATQASFRSNVLYSCIKAPIKLGFDRVRSDNGHGLFINRRVPAVGQLHILESFLQFAKALGITESVIDWKIVIPDEAHAWARAQLSAQKPILAVNPAAAKAERGWPTERYVATLTAAQQRWGVQVVLTGGPAPHEQKIAEEITAQLKGPVCNLVGKTSLLQLAALYTQVDVLLAPDTGPAHLAAAVGAPVVGLYAVAPPELSAPYPCRHLVVNKYPEAVTRLLKKDLATLPFATRVHHPETMRLITVDDVLEKLGCVLGI